MEDSNIALVDDLLRLIPHTEIVHHIPGRIRLRLLRSGVSVALKMDLEGIMDSVPGILKVRVNAVVGSVVVEYEKEKLPYQLWEMLTRLKQEPDLAEEARKRLLAVWD